MKNWLKGGLILSGISFLYFILAVCLIIGNPITSGEGFAAIILLSFYFIILIIPIFGIGALMGSFIGWIIRKDLSYSLKGAFIGLIIGIFLSILPVLSGILKKPLAALVQLVIYLVLGFVVGLAIGFIVGKVKSQKATLIPILAPK